MNIHADPVPLHLDETGAIRVANTRITLDVLMRSLFAGVTPEQAVSEDCWPTLSLADVHAVLAYYYRHKAEVDGYLQRRRDEADQQQNEIEAKQPSFAEVKQHLLAKRNVAHATPAE